MGTYVMSTSGVGAGVGFIVITSEVFRVVFRLIFGFTSETLVTTSVVILIVLIVLSFETWIVGFTSGSATNFPLPSRLVGVRAKESCGTKKAATSTAQIDILYILFIFLIIFGYVLYDAWNSPLLQDKPKCVKLWFAPRF